MASKQFMLNEQTSVTIYKRKTSRSLRLTIAHNGEIRVSIPSWTPYHAGVSFARSKLDWIESQRRPAKVLQSGQAIGKAHHLRLMPKATTTGVKTRVLSTEILVTYPSHLAETDAAVQKAAEAACIRALRVQAEKLLPVRLRELAKQHDFEYGSISIKRLKGRWGSCDHQKNIVLNLFLMQLPWECIDYVILHELTHTEIMRHGPEFWSAMERVLPNVASCRKAIRHHQPTLLSA